MALVFPYLPAVGGGGLPKLVTWANGTDAEIAAMIAAAEAGKLELSLFWSVGDKRTVHLTAMETSTGIDETHPAQDVELVITQFGTYKDANDKTVNAIVQLDNCLYEKGKMNTTNTTAGSWNSCPRRTWCNTIFYNALPSTLKPIFKQFKTVTATEYDSSTLTTSLDYAALTAEAEVFGSNTGGTTYYSNSVERAALTQWEYYKSTANRRKGAEGTSNVYWFLRSPYTSTNFCSPVGGNTQFYGASTNCGIAPFMCI